MKNVLLLIFIFEGRIKISRPSLRFTIAWPEKAIFETLKIEKSIRFHQLIKTLMLTKRNLYLIGFLIVMLMLSSCYSSRKGRKSSNRFHRERCDCSRFSNMVQHEKTCTIDWIAQHGGEENTQ